MNWLKNAIEKLIPDAGILRVVLMIIVSALGAIIIPAFLYVWAWYAAVEFIVKRVWVPFYKSMKPISYFAAAFIVFSMVVLIIGVSQGVVNLFEVFSWPLVKFWNILPMSNNDSLIVCASLYLLVGIGFVMLAFKRAN